MRAEQSRAEQSRAEQSSRFVGFDILKFICAFLIVCIHCPFQGAVGAYFTALTRIAVPIFFMITGYYYCNTVRRGRAIVQIKKILVLLIGANLLYFAWKCFYAVASGDGLKQYLGGIFTIKNAAKFILLNESPFNGHLWYLGAILYVLIIVEALRKFGGGYWKRWLYISTPVLLTGDLLLGKYSLLLWGREFQYIIVRNWLFVGIPYFSIGMLLREKQERMLVPKSDNQIRRRTHRLAYAIVLFSMTTFVERTFLVSMKVNATRDHYISTTFLAIVVFCLFLQFYQYRHSEKIEGQMAMIGRQYSTWIYIIHPIFITIFVVVMRKTGLYEIYAYVAPIVIYAVSIAVVAIIGRAVERIKGIDFHG